MYPAPLLWGGMLTTKAHHEGLIERPRYAAEINEELAKVRSGCGVIIGYDWISLPLVYTQVWIFKLCIRN